MLKPTIGLFRDAWRLAGPFWTSAQGRTEKGSSRAMAYVLFASVVAMSFGSVYVSVLLNDWRGDFYNGLQHFIVETDPTKAAALETEIWRLMFVFLALAMTLVFVGAYQRYLTQSLQIRWRRWMTERYQNFYLSGHAFYLWNLMGQATDNPDQRITEDIRDFVDLFLELTLGLIEKITSLISFSIILWNLSVPIFVFGHEFPGLLMWSAYLYALIGTGAVHAIGRKLAGLTVSQQKLEADFRYNLIRVREHAESIALSKGEPAENRTLRGRFFAVVGNFMKIMVTTKQINLVGGTYGQLGVIFPFMLLLPGFFLKKIELGGMMKAYEAFNSVLDALSYFVDSYGKLARWSAIMTRLTGFLNTVEAAHDVGPQIAQKVTENGESKDVNIRQVALALPNGDSLRQDINLNLHAREATLISGASGSGKSTLLRATAGVWPYLTGSISLPAGTTTMFLPQKPYLPVDTLAAALAYPLESSTFDAKVMTDFMTLLRLGHLVPRLQESANWTLIVSGGEAQRIQIIRALLQKPDWLFMDESTSAMDEELQTIVYRTLKAQLPNTTIVSVGHRETLEAFHQQRYDFVSGTSTKLPA